MAKSPIASDKARPFEDFSTNYSSRSTNFNPFSLKIEADKVKQPVRKGKRSTSVNAKKPLSEVERAKRPSAEADKDHSTLYPDRKDDSVYPSIKEDPAPSKRFTNEDSHRTSVSSVHSDEKSPFRAVSPRPGQESVPPPHGDSDSYMSAASDTFSAEEDSSSCEFCHISKKYFPMLRTRTL